MSQSKLIVDDAQSALNDIFGLIDPKDHHILAYLLWQCLRHNNGAYHGKH